MGTSVKKKKIIDQIINGKLEAALENLILLTEKTEHYNTVLLLTAQYNDLSRQMRLAVIDPSNAVIRRNRIISALLDILNDLDWEDDTPSEPGKTPPPDTRKKLALVIGCDDYEYAGILSNPLHDARDISQELEALGFTVIQRFNPNLKELKIAVDDFGIELKNFDVGLFYFAGHGVQVNGLNYLVPVEANLLTERNVEYDCIRADRVLIYMDDSNTDVNIIILDACRNNPFERSWQRGGDGQGLAPMDAPKGSLIAYATAPGKTASDGTGKNGLYTGELIKHIGEQGLSITQMFQKVRKSVIDISQNKQMPWESTSLTGDFYFNP